MTKRRRKKPVKVVKVLAVVEDANRQEIDEMLNSLKEASQPLQIIKP